MQRVTRIVAAGMAALVIGGMTMAAVDPIPLSWRTVVNDGDLIPSTREMFAFYDEPSMNMDGIVAFRAGGGEEMPMTGVFSREMMTISDAPVLGRATVMLTVPPPNNTLAMFHDFPGLARISDGSESVGLFGETDPVWTWTRPDGTKMYQGTLGHYLSVKDVMFTGATMLGDVREPYTGDLLFAEFSVPDAPMGTAFDRFVGAPGVSGQHIVVFNGEYTDPLTNHPESGIYFRNVLADGGFAPTELIANTRTMIPDQMGRVGMHFGWLSPPSVAGREIVFVGVDFEPSPSIGGIYLATLDEPQTLRTLVAIGDPVPADQDPTARQAEGDLSDGRPRHEFTRFGPTVSFDGRYVGFWAAWGYETYEVRLTPPATARIPGLSFCREQNPDLFTVEVPAHQGIFVHDTETGVTHRIADNGDRFAEFLYWSFTEDPHVGEPIDGPTFVCPKPVASAYVAVATAEDDTFRVAFRALRATCGGAGHRVPPMDLGDGRPPTMEPIDAIFLSGGPGFGTPLVVVDTTMAGDLYDDEAPTGMVVDAVGLEREGLRNGRLAVAIGMTDEIGTSWGGVYFADITEISWCHGDINGDSNVGFEDLLTMLAEWECFGPCSSDLNEDGEVGFEDLLSLLAHWGSCP